MVRLAFKFGLACVVACHFRDGAATPEAISSDSFFYGQSPPVYPSPKMTGAGSWQDAYSKAQVMVSRMSMEEKMSLTAGVSISNGCGGNIPAIARLGFPGLCLSDAGSGVRGTDLVSAWPSGLHIGASWNKRLASNHGSSMAGEFKRKGVNVILGPSVGGLGRVVPGGRAWEAYSVDPYLSGALVHEVTAAAQGAGVMASTKHFIGNEQETHRRPNRTSGVEAVSSNIDDRTMHEFYLWPFQDAVHAGTGVVMCSYQRINNSYGCANSKTLNGLLKGELGFQGFVVSDWDAQHAGVATALSGLDMAMPNDAGFWGANLSTALKNGSVPESRLTDMATRIIASWYQMGQDKNFPAPGIGMPAEVSKPHTSVDARIASDRKILYDGAVEGHVLVKNVDNALPLKKPKILSLYGYSAKAPDLNTYISARGRVAWQFGLQSADENSILASIAGYSVEQSPIAINGTIISGGGSGASSPSILISPFDALMQQAYRDNSQLFWDFTGAPVTPNSESDACLVMGNAFASETFDRPSLRDDYTDNLIKSVANRCANTVVIFHNAGTRLVDQWADHPNITALIFAHLPGQESGNALVDILYGKANPSGRLPYTVAKNESDYGTLAKPSIAEGIYTKFPQSNFSEGVYVDYRHFDRAGIEPRYPFGFGLSYTTYQYRNLRICRIGGANFKSYPTGTIREGGQTGLWDVLVKVTVDVANNGKMDGAEVAQLYVGIPNAPSKQLRGFEKPSIKAGRSTSVSFKLTRRDLSVWDTKTQKWLLQEGNYRFYVGPNSRDLPLTDIMNFDKSSISSTVTTCG